MSRPYVTHRIPVDNLIDNGNPASIRQFAGLDDYIGGARQHAGHSAFFNYGNTLVRTLPDKSLTGSIRRRKGGGEFLLRLLFNGHFILVQGDGGSYDFLVASGIFPFAGKYGHDDGDGTKYFFHKCQISPIKARKTIFSLSCNEL